MSTSQQQILRWEKGQKPASIRDELAAEEPLEIRVDNHPVSVTMRTPGHDRELAVGFLFCEGLLKSARDIQKVEHHPRSVSENVINVFSAPHVTVDLKKLTRHVFASSSCGLCGKATIEMVRQQFAAVDEQFTVSASTVLELPRKLRSAQQAFERSGGLHAAAIFDSAGNLIITREDIGRHNAVDKVIGYCLMKGITLNRSLLLVSGRASFEIIQKGLAASIPVIVALSAPSDLAVRFAIENGQTLIAFLRENRMNVYSHAARVSFEETDSA